MKTDNITWANSLIKREYPSWVGIDNIIDTFIQECLIPRGVVLDIGCGKRSPVAKYRNGLGLLVGVDLEFQDLKENMDIEALVIADGANGLPFPCNSFDLIFSKTVIEHLADPLSFFCEVYRLLKPSGRFVLATSNLHSLPIFLSFVTPLAVHRWVYQRIFGKRLNFDQFPVYYRANTKRTLDWQLVRAGFVKVVLSSASWPQYFAVNRVLFRLLLRVHRLSDQLGSEILQPHLLAIYRKGMVKPESAGVSGGNDRSL